ncbi:ribosome recycling factor [Candidatus Falkowbacteria bacterium RIFOXYB2_FULL_47_14]|uniref:Ribosome-recycling factor n=1 Tax=Candidatus Falkowbacteria bacterium RIFOXYA2_FULL_47_19 TaxID=1797994 RepID=A0A1F5SHT5_9BACT|nr:MAG: ribosome recycling factor [Candidatus Falkowbacteria bacterium RIFOXYA2_FULL_47_19]OGF35835.1 MAG: ribosome recycling factor [Candidatus Falkowbacteria bacterium RIFOXYC2_FULL_46_15]OGF42709.1 MAG: ribosome recycling factor [Candidatus Falkowbacteria bacterium RIFOXYB2_FULL_47_14]
MNQFIESKKEEFNKAVDFFKKEISSLRTGRANPNMLEGVTVDAYGAKTPLNGVASISVPDGQSIIIAPWDKGILKEIEKAMVEADLGVGVVNEGDKIRLTIPMMTEENRRDLVKKLNEKQEAARVALRKIREEVKESIERAEKNKEIPEDDKFRYMKELDELMAGKNDEIKSVRDKKEKDIMTI